MKTLEDYKKNGHTFTQYARSGGIAIFHGRRVGGRSETWEVIHVQSHNGREIAGKFVEPAEFPPSNEQWGSKGWTYQNPELARDRFEVEIEKEMRKPATPADVTKMVQEVKDYIAELP